MRLNPIYMLTAFILMLYFVIFIGCENPSLNSLPTSYQSAKVMLDTIMLTSDDFDDGWGNWSDGGIDCSRSTSGGWNNTPAIILRDNSSTSRLPTTNSYDISDGIDLGVMFKLKGNGMDYNEGIIFQLFDGLTWQNIVTLLVNVDFENNEFSNHFFVIQSSEYNFPSNARFRFISTGSIDKDRVYIDDVHIDLKRPKN